MRVFDYVQQSVTEGRTERRGHITAEITDRRWLEVEIEDELSEQIVRLAVQLEPRLDGLEPGQLRRRVLYTPKGEEPVISQDGIGIWEITVE
jgi:hypothetical protein